MPNNRAPEHSCQLRNRLSDTVRVLMLDGNQLDYEHLQELERAQSRANNHDNWRPAHFGRDLLVLFAGHLAHEDLRRFAFGQVPRAQRVTAFDLFVAQDNLRPFVVVRLAYIRSVRLDWNIMVVLDQNPENNLHAQRPLLPLTPEFRLRINDSQSKNRFLLAFVSLIKNQPFFNYELGRREKLERAVVESKLFSTLVCHLPLVLAMRS